MAERDSPPSSPSAKSQGRSPLENKPKQQNSQTSSITPEKAMKAFLEPRRLLPTTAQRSFLNTAEMSRIQVSGHSILCYTWAPEAPSPNGSILLSHGYGTSAASMLHFVPPLLAAKFCVIAFDHFGHGESDGSWGDLNVFISTIRHLALSNAPLAGIIGYSVGATCAVITLAQTPQISCPALVCLSPPTRMKVLLERFCKANGWEVGLAKEIELAMEQGRVRVPTDVRELLGKRSIQTKMLVVHDQDDRIVPVADVAWLVQAVPGSRFEATKALGHWKGLMDPGVVEKVSSFVIDVNREARGSGGLKL